MKASVQTSTTAVLLAVLTLASGQTVADSAAKYVDVHVHLRGTTTSGLLGNAHGSKGGPSKGPRGHGMNRPRRRGGKADAQSDTATKENLRKAVKVMLKNMDKHNVEYALAVIVPGPKDVEGEYNMQRDIAKAYPDRIKLLAGGAVLSPWLQNVEPDRVSSADRNLFRQRAERLLDDGAVGFGEMLSYHLSMAEHHSFKYCAPNHPLFLELADIAAERDVAIDVHMEAITKSRPTPSNLLKASSKNPRTLEPTIPAFEKLLKHNRQARIVWQHVGWDNTGDMTPVLLRRLLKDHFNLYMALRVEKRAKQQGDGPPMQNRIVNSKGKVKAEWKKLFKDYPDRFVIGSDMFFFPVESERPNQSFNETWSILDDLPKDLAKKIGSENPRRIYAFDYKK